MAQLEPEAFGMSEDMVNKAEIQYAWKLAIYELQKIPFSMTPREKLL